MPFNLPDPWVPDASIQRNFDALKTEIGRLSLPIARVTSLPANPSNNQEVYYVADATNGVVWHLKYNAGSASAYKWEFVGGSPMFHEIAADQGTASATYVDLGTAGPTVTLPALQGDYRLMWKAETYSTGGTPAAYMTPSIGGAAPAAADEAVWSFSTVGITNQTGRQLVKTALAASAVIKLQYKVSANTVNWLKRSLWVTPIRVG
jgi:hypothetical protein